VILPLPRKKLVQWNEKDMTFHLFFFSLFSLTAAGYLCYLRTINHLIEQSHRLPWKEDLVKMNPRTLGVTVLFAFIFMVMLKAYCIGIVWRCYKYLTIRQNALLLTYIIPESTNQERSYNSLLPGYDEAVSMKITPPPSYQQAIQQQNLTVSLSPEPSTESISETEPPSYNAAHQQLEQPASPTNSSLRTDDADEIQAATGNETFSQQQPQQSAAAAAAAAAQRDP